ncbi:cytochrome C551 [Lysobacter concretionis Ko07 = DSM 16239]|jgi:cation diffusion facilitator family transporter|uniref:Cytochrome C551 n=1 Tax=Lysobacter concretionis Ko07 = DSM 16239 TaxID=1122185 RepID=A0A0A0EPW4_9GAMM|nr:MULTISPECIES: cation diffusion facilitator family transporter [Lysobacter]KGM52469.1 cytochrome C551 [Lysobacter concretionis Ko07 = DSM 16239]QOD91781.1 cation diffusion facilitator family transporter [Lysobacter sp. CW239]
MAGNGDSTKAILFALGANFAIAAAKGTAAFFTGSSAMLAETVHSLADCGNQGLLLLGLKQAKQAPSADHPLGYGRAIYFWSFLVAVMLFTVGGMFSLYEGIHKLQAPATEGGSSLWWAVAVLSFAIIAEGISMRVCLQEVNKSRGHRGVWRWFRESRQAELVVIFGEDLAALLGLVFALVAVVATMVTGNPLWDAIGTIGIGALLIIVAVFVAIEIKAMLIGQSVDPERQRQIRQFLDGRPEIIRVISVITMQLGNEAMVSVQAQMREERDVRALVAQINTIERAMKQAFPEVRWSFFEPDVRPGI